MNLNNTSSGKQYNNVGSGSQYNAENITIHHAANDSGDKDRQFLIDLKLSDPRLDKERIERTKGGLLKDSYLWILNNEDFQRWRADHRNQLLWIRGDPGKGKTMLLCGIVDEFQKEKSTHQPIYFFCQATDSNLTTASAVLRGILYLMLKKKPQLIKGLRDTHDHNGRHLFEGINAWDTLCDMITAVLEDESFQDAVIIIDALDECATDVDKLLDFINKLSSKAVRFIVSSRNWPTIERRIAAATQRATHLSLELNEASISAAVVAFINHKVGLLAQNHEYSTATRNLVCNTLVQNSNSTFLWAALVCQQLTDSNINDWEVGSKLAEFPPGLDVLYARMLHQALSSTNVNLFRRILAVVSVVFRPVNIAELRSLLGPLGEVFNEPRFLEKAVRQCGSFLTVRNNTVYFVHQSAKDFLLENSTLEKVMLEGIGYEHALIWMNSLQAMSKTLRRNIYDLKTPGTSVDDAPTPSPDPLESVRYSCIHWIEHLCTARWMEPYQADLIEYFFERKFLHWAEATCILRSVYKVAESTSKLSSALKYTTGFSKLAALVQDAFYFLQQHREVIGMAPLQIYCSVLLFSPQKSLVRELYLHEVPDWILTKPHVKEEEWNTSLQVFGHHRYCQTLTFSRDGHLLVSASLDDMKIWDAKTGQCLRTIEPSDGRIGQVILSHDGSILVAVIGSRRCKLWSVETGDCLQTCLYRSEGSDIRSVALSQNGHHLAIGSTDMTVTLWDTETGTCFQTLNGHSSSVVAVEFSPDGSTLASAATSIRIWNTRTGDCLQIMRPDVRFRISSIIYTYEGRRIVSVSWKSRPRSHETCSIGVWETSTGQCLWEKDIFDTELAESGGEGTPFSMSSHDGGMIVFRTPAKTTKVWRLQTGDGDVRNTTVHPYRIAGIAISNDGERLATVSHEGTVGIQDLAIYRGGGLERQDTRPMLHDNTILSTPELSFLERKRDIEAQTRQIEAERREIAAKTRQMLEALKEQREETLKSLNNETPSLPHPTTMWSTQSTSPLPIQSTTRRPTQSTTPSSTQSATFMHPGLDLLESLMRPGLRLEDRGLSTRLGNHGREISSNDVDDNLAPIQSVNLSVDGSRAVSVRQGQYLVDIWDTKSGRCLQRLRIPNNTIRRRDLRGSKSTAAFTRDDRVLFAIADDLGGMIIDATEGSRLSRLKTPRYRWSVDGIIFSGDATRLAITRLTGPGEGKPSIQICNPITGQHMWTFYLMEEKLPLMISSPSSSSPSKFPFSFSERNSAQWLSSSGSELYTSCGIIDLTLPQWSETLERPTEEKMIKVKRTRRIDSASPEIDFISQARVSESTLRGYYIKGHWIMKDMDKMVWLPEEYRPCNGAYVVRDSALAVGCDSGHVVLFEFS